MRPLTRPERRSHIFLPLFEAERLLTRSRKTNPQHRSNTAPAPHHHHLSDGPLKHRLPPLHPLPSHALAHIVLGIHVGLGGKQPLHHPRKVAARRRPEGGPAVLRGQGRCGGRRRRPGGLVGGGRKGRRPNDGGACGLRRAGRWTGVRTHLFVWKEKDSDRQCGGRRGSNQQRRWL